VIIEYKNPLLGGGWGGSLKDKSILNITDLSLV
jgi:hypothetical protein